MNTFEEKILEMREMAIKEFEGSETQKLLEELRVKYLGKKGEVTKLAKSTGDLPVAQRPGFGMLINNLRGDLEALLEERQISFEQFAIERKISNETLDITLPGKEIALGKRHPLSKILEETEDIFIGMGFTIERGPEIESDYYNFEALNMPKNHPARDTQDTFYIDENTVLRTQTSPVQIRVMENQQPPIRIISPGRVYRADEVDATHLPVFHQIEGLVVDKGISMSDLKGTLELFAKKLYGEGAKFRFRPHHFRFTEPSAEMDTMCFNCEGKGCRLCKNEGWIEILGCGMVHPKVLANCGIDPEVYNGFAFGMGLERMVLRKYNIDDIRLFYENDVRFLKQF